MFIGKSHFSIGDPSVKSHSCAPAHAKDYVVYFSVWLIMACIQIPAARTAVSGPGKLAQAMTKNNKLKQHLSKINGVSSFKALLTCAIIHIFHLHHLSADSSPEQVARALCGRLTVF